MERTKADEALHIGQVFASLGGVLAITLSGVGVIVRMTPPMDGTAKYWWWTALACAVAGAITWAAFARLSNDMRRSETEPDADRLGERIGAPPLA
jgi:cytochrome c-type biogenesis protein CcmH/NrfF